MVRKVLGFCALWVAGVASALAAPALLVQTTQHGDFLMIGNTLGHDCAPGVPAPVVGTVGACGTNVNDSAIDVYWAADLPAAGQATAHTAIPMASSRSTAVLALPAGAQVTHAYLYWAATRETSGTDTTARIERLGVFSEAVTADASLTGIDNSYRSRADITALVQAQGSGAYRVSEVEGRAVASVNQETLFSAWWMVVVYQHDAEPLRNLAVFDGWDRVATGAPQVVPLSGFLVPFAGFTGKLGVVALEGDSTINGDQLLFNGSPPLSDAANPVNNFFNSTRSRLGMPVSVAGDLPQTTGGAGSLSGIDLDIVDVTARLTAGQTSATIQATSTGDIYHLATFVTSITTFEPAFGDSAMTVADLNGGTVAPGDALEYRVVVKNAGNDVSQQTRLTDPLPIGVEYVPGSLQVVTGPNVGTKTDVSDDDQAEYDAIARTVKFRLGTGANALQGGELVPDEETEIRFRVIVNASDCSGAWTIENQASIAATGQMGGQPLTFLTDGDSATPGSQPTSLDVDLRCLTLATAGTGIGSIVPTPLGTSCGTNCHAYVAGTPVSLAAQASAGSGFTGWSGDAAGNTTPVNVLLDQPRHVVATFMPMSADLYLDVSATPSMAVVGDTVLWSILAGNAGPMGVNGARLVDTPPARLGNVAWECIAGACPVPAEGEDAIDVALNLPVGATASFTLYGTLLPNPDGEVAAVVINEASIALADASGLTDPIPDNNSASDGVLAIPTGIFSDGFE